MNLLLVFLIVFNITGILDKSTDQSALKELVEINTEIHNSFDYGIGLPGYPTFEETVKFGNGHCGLYVSYFAERIGKLGYKSTVLDLISDLKADNLIHSVVEVKLGDKVYTFDPTLNIYYEHTVNELINEYKNYHGEIDSEQLKVYSNPYFWENIKEIKVYNNLNYFQSNLLNKYENVVKSNVEFYAAPNDFKSCLDEELVNSYCATTSSSTGAVSIDINFKTSLPIQRLYFVWYDSTNYPRSIKVINNETGEQLVDIQNYDNKTGFLDVWTKNSEKTGSITIIFDNFNGQERLLLRRFSVY